MQNYYLNCNDSKKIIRNIFKMSLKNIFSGPMEQSCLYKKILVMHPSTGLRMSGIVTSIRRHWLIKQNNLCIFPECLQTLQTIPPKMIQVAFDMNHFFVKCMEILRKRLKAIWSLSIGCPDVLVR